MELILVLDDGNNDNWYKPVYTLAAYAPAGSTPLALALPVLTPTAPHQFILIFQMFIPDSVRSSDVMSLAQRPCLFMCTLSSSAQPHYCAESQVENQPCSCLKAVFFGISLFGRRCSAFGRSKHAHTKALYGCSCRQGKVTEWIRRKCLGEACRVAEFYCKNNI